MKNFIFLSFACFFLSASCEDEMPVVINCENGFITQNEECVCPEGSVTAYENCVTLNDNQFYGITNGCPCLDTLILTIVDGEGENLKVMNVNQGLSLSNEDQIRLQRETFMIVYESSVGDSLIQFDNGGGFISCDALPEEEFNEYVTLEGLFSADGNTIDANLTYWHGTATDLNEIGNCQVSFAKQ